jgi:serine phosphatase RsbU (regulator of sigma subunit)
MFLWNNITRRKANRLLHAKNLQLNEQNRQITSSIIYARFIQTTILPPPDFFKEIFPQHFVFYQPRDIVSGDFYWITKKDEYILVAVADCTGHGVPGALMSMLGMTFLNEIVNIAGIIDPEIILHQMRNRIIDALRQRNQNSDTRDGMDIALCTLNTDDNTLWYSGAYIPLLIYRNGVLEEIAADKMPIGYHRTKNHSFRKHMLQLEAGNTIYLTTDGYGDQFSGGSGRKYLRRNFYRLLESVARQDIGSQQKSLENEFFRWKGAGEQIDDVTVLGIKV